MRLGEFIKQSDVTEMQSHCRITNRQSHSNIENHVTQHNYTCNSERCGIMSIALSLLTKGVIRWHPFKRCRFSLVSLKLCK